MSEFIDKQELTRTLRTIVERLEAEETPKVVTMGKPFGTSHWSGTVDGQPAMALCHYGGASLAVFTCDGWEYRKFESRSHVMKWLGVKS